MKHRGYFSDLTPAEEKHRQIVVFSEKLPDFKKEIILGRLFISRSFPKKKLKIVIATPYLPPEKPDSEARLIKGGLPIRIALKRLEETCLEMQTRIILGWESFVERKIRHLIRAIEEAPKCPNCKKDSFYPTKNEKGSISYKCHLCGKIVTPKYGSGFSLLNSYIVKN